MSVIIEKPITSSTPYIYIDESKCYMRFEGESFHENVMEFYAEISAWLTQFLKTDFGEFTFDCQLKYFNSSTAKLLFNMLLEMDSHATSKNKVIINWITDADNEIIIECGEDFKEEVANAEFNIVRL